MRVLHRLVAVAALALAAPLPTDAEGDPPSSVRDLAYGEVLFHFWQQEHFNALVRLLAALERDEVPQHAADADLLLGGLYLSYGQHRLAGELFEHMLAKHDDPAVHDRAWFYLAKLWRQRGYFVEAEAALQRIGNRLPPSLEPERQFLGAQLAMDQGRFDEAERQLSSVPLQDDKWAAYADYNLGVALVRLGRTAEGAARLERIGTQRLGRAPNEPTAALRDRANVALGYAWLQSGRADLAKPPFERVRLTGPFSNRALLGVGWADVELAEFRSALASWIELKDRSALDPSVQEALLAVPYAFAQLRAEGQAADHYLEAIAVFDEELARLEGSIRTVREGGLIDALLERPGFESEGGYEQLDAIPNTAESRYLYELVSTHGFQEALKNYRDLVLLIANLDDWSASLGAFDDILDTRQQAFERRRPVIDASLDEIDVAALGLRRVELESQLAIVERRRDIVALGSAEQQRLWRELDAMAPALEQLRDQPSGEALRRKHRFLQGLLTWELERDYPVRVREIKLNLRRLDLELKRAEARRYSVSTARDAWPDQFEALTRRIGHLEPRIAALRAAAAAALERQRGFIEARAIDELEGRRERLVAYRVQAQFSLAALYDRAAARTSAARTSAVADGARP